MIGRKWKTKALGIAVTLMLAFLNASARAQPTGTPGKPSAFAVPARAAPAEAVSEPNQPPPQYEPDACTDSDDRCYELYETARSQSAAGQYDAALINYQSAYARRPVPWLLISIGRMQQKLFRYPQAIANYRRYLALPHKVSDPELRTKAQIYLNQVLDLLEEQKLLRIPELPAPPPKPPLYKQWWFWTAILGTATVLAIGLGVGLTQQNQGCQTVATYHCFSFRSP